MTRRRGVLGLALLAALCLLVVVAAAVLIVLRAGADDDDWDPEAQFAPSLRPAFGARTDGDRLELWTGAPCHDVTGATVTFSFDGADSAAIRLAAPAPGTTLERFDPAVGSGTLRVAEPLPDDVDWREAETVGLLLQGSDFRHGATVELEEVVAGSGEHPADTFWFQGVGWLDPAEVAAADGESFLTPCTPDPARL